jgi:hypothetical protein
MSSDGLKAILNPSAAVATSTSKPVKKAVKKALIPELPDIPTAPGPPTTDDAEVQAASAKERKLLRLRRGRQSTILSRPKLQQSGDTLG